MAFDGGEHLVHSGMSASALYLLERLYSLAKALKDEYQLILVGHSLGAGAAALLAMMLKSRGITNMHCYAFAPPMCCEPDLASTCSDCVTSVIFRDDIISRISQESVVALYQELVEYDWEAASKNEDTHPELRKYTEMARTVAGSRVGSWLGLSAFTQSSRRQAAANSPALSSSGSEEAEEGSPKGKGQQFPDEDQGYNPLVPGRVVYIHRSAVDLEDTALVLTAYSATLLPSHYSDAYGFRRASREEGMAGLGRVVTDGTCPGLRRIHLSGLMLADHLTDSYFEALGSTNPTKQDAIGEGN